MRKRKPKQKRRNKELNPRSASFLRSFQWKSLRVKALNRDGCKCVLCGCHDGLTVHHVIERRAMPELALCLDNLVTLCKSCHFRIHHHYEFSLHAWLFKNRRDQFDWLVGNVQMTPDVPRGIP